MPDFSTFSPLLKVPSPTEFSSLRNPRDKDSVVSLWKHVSEIAQMSNKHSQILNQQSRDIKKIGQRRTLDLDLFPFEIYTLPQEFRPTIDQAQYTSSINWRTVRVRSGLILNSLVSTGSFVNGTDGMQNFAYYNFLPSSSQAQVGPCDIQVPINTPQYWFWIEESGSLNSTNPSPYFLRYSSTPGTADSGPIIGNPNGWMNWPTASNSYIPIGYVDTNTSGSQNIAYVRQFLNSDYLSSNASGSNGSVSAFTVDLEYPDFVVSGDTLIAKPDELQGFVGVTTINTFPVSFTGGGGSNATAVAYVNGAGSITDIQMLDCGTGYTNTNVTGVFSVGGGHGATASFYIGADTRLTAYAGTGSNSGSGYTNFVTDTVAIYPAYSYGSVIYATQPVGGTGVFGTWVSGSQNVIWQDLNVSAREIRSQFATCEVFSISGSTGMNRLVSVSPPYSAGLL